jgi:hypothetical protein
VSLPGRTASALARRREGLYPSASTPGYDTAVAVFEIGFSESALTHRVRSKDHGQEVRAIDPEEESIASALGAFQHSSPWLTDRP